MFRKLVSRNDDLRRLVEHGYAVAFEPGYLIVRDIPYLDEQKRLQVGAFVTAFEMTDAETVKQVDHQVFFAGSVPHNLDGTPIPNLGGGPVTVPLGSDSNDVIVQRSFSNKPRPTGVFADFFEKIESYTTIISGPVQALFPDVTPYTYRTMETFPDSVFKFHDTLTSRALIGDLAAKLKDDVVAVIGLGGTGAYLLDFLAKTPVREIRAFDHDVYHVHTAFRSPGRLDESDFGRRKAEVYQARYETFRHGLTMESRAIDAASADLFDGVTFAFVCVDKGASRRSVFELLIALKIPFIDVGMGISRQQGLLNGQLRVTTYPAADAVVVRDKGYAPLADGRDDEYRSSIQTSELNALNASLAMIRFKQMRGFYSEDVEYEQLVFEVGDCKTVGRGVGEQ